MNAAGRQAEDTAERCRIQNDTELALRQFLEKNDLSVPEIQSSSFVAAQQRRGVR
jgi:hypothetical protein